MVTTNHDGAERCCCDRCCRKDPSRGLTAAQDALLVDLVIAGSDGISSADFDSGMTGRSWRPLVERGLVEFKPATAPATFVVTTAGREVLAARS